MTIVESESHTSPSNRGIKRRLVLATRAEGKVYQKGCLVAVNVHQITF